MTWAVRFVRWIDQTGNFFADGDPDSTISARIGYHTRPEVNNPGRFWLWLRSIVDWTFLPLDGPFHCYQAYQYDRYERFRPVGLLSGLLLSLFVLAGCAVVTVVVRPWARYPALLLLSWLYHDGLIDWLADWVRGLL